jgi:hypothetical protein
MELKLVFSTFATHVLDFQIPLLHAILILFLVPVVKTCCDTNQLKTMDQNILLAAAFLQRCPSCLQNLVKHICDFTCGVNQSRFINVTDIEHSDDGG